MTVMRAAARIVVCLGLPCAAGACAHSGAPAISAAGAGDMAGRTAAASADTFEVAYRGMGGAIRTPLKDLNFAHDRIAPALKRAAAAPYDLQGLGGCVALTEEIAALDLALGPDLDTPDVEKGGDIYSRGAGLAADAALDAMRSAAAGYLPMRSVIRRLSGAEKLEHRARRAVLAGSVRRGFLKAIGLERGCAWPAAPLGARPAALEPSAPVLVAAASPPKPPGGASAAASEIGAGLTLASLEIAEPPPLAVPAIAAEREPRAAVPPAAAAARASSAAALGLHGAGAR